MKNITLLLLLLLLTGCAAVPPHNISSDADGVFELAVRHPISPPAIIQPIDVNVAPQQATLSYEEPLAPIMQLKAEKILKTVKKSRKTAEKSAKNAVITPETDPVVSQLHKVQISLTAPSVASVFDRLPVDLVVAPLNVQIDTSPTSFTGEVKISKIAIASIHAPDFDIETVAPEKQAIAYTEPTSWKWILSPKQSGNYNITVSLVAVVYVDNTSAEHHIKTFEKTIKVQISWWQRANMFITQNWQWIWTTILVPVAGTIWARKRKRR